MHTNEVDPDLVEITQNNKFCLESFWGLERTCLVHSLLIFLSLSLRCGPINMFFQVQNRCIPCPANPFCMLNHSNQTIGCQVTAGDCVAWPVG
jgi:hypothetical protein